MQVIQAENVITDDEAVGVSHCTAQECTGVCVCVCVRVHRLSECVSMGVYTR